jgi:hypothetical protein
LGDSLNITPNPPVPRITPWTGAGVAEGEGVLVGVVVGEKVDEGIIVAVPVWVGGEVVVGMVWTSVSVVGGVTVGMTTKIAPPRLSILKRTTRLIRITVIR